jgi:hypothetical protein
MNYSGVLREAVLVVMGITAVATLLFPALYSRHPWRSSPVGRALMLKASSTAAAVNVTFLLVFIRPPIEIRYIILLIAFSGIAVSNIWVTYVMLSLNRKVEDDEILDDKQKPGVTK